jgi:hypothetical protein
MESKKQILGNNMLENELEVYDKEFFTTPGGYIRDINKKIPKKDYELIVVIKEKHMPNSPESIQELFAVNDFKVVEQYEGIVGEVRKQDSIRKIPLGSEVYKQIALKNQPNELIRIYALTSPECKIDTRFKNVYKTLANIL